MNLPRFKTIALFITYILLLQLHVACNHPSSANKETGSDSSGVAVLLVDTDHSLSTIDENIYGHFL